MAWSVCRAVLGIAEAAGIPAAGKAIVSYLRPGERAVGQRHEPGGRSLGWMMAPMLATGSRCPADGAPFIVTGVLGLLWVPLWLVAGARRRWPPARARRRARFRDRRLWVFAGANALSMTGYSFWSQLDDKYLVTCIRLTLAEPAWYVWIPPVFAMLGGFLGGWALPARWCAGRGAAPARFRVCRRLRCVAGRGGAAVGALAGWAAAGISLSMFAIAAFSVNMYTLPFDCFGGRRRVRNFHPGGELRRGLGGARPALGEGDRRSRLRSGHVILAVTPLLACAVLWATRATR